MFVITIETQASPNPHSSCNCASDFRTTPPGDRQISRGIRRSVPS